MEEFWDYFSLGEVYTERVVKAVTGFYFFLVMQFVTVVFENFGLILASHKAVSIPLLKQKIVIL